MKLVVFLMEPEGLLLPVGLHPVYELELQLAAAQKHGMQEGIPTEVLLGGDVTIDVDD